MSSLDKDLWINYVVYQHSLPLPRSWSPERWLAWPPKGQRGEALARGQRWLLSPLQSTQRSPTGGAQETRCFHC